MKEAETVIEIKQGYRVHISRSVFKAIGAKEGDFVKVKVWKNGD